MIRENYNKYLIDYVSRGADLEQVILPTSVGLPDPLLGEMLSSLLYEDSPPVAMERFRLNRFQ